MAKKLENMTQDERIEYWHNVREKERINRRNRIAKLSMEQRAAVISVHTDMGGIRAVTAFDLQELSEAMDILQFQFNLRS